MNISKVKFIHRKFIVPNIIKIDKQNAHRKKALRERGKNKLNRTKRMQAIIDRLIILKKMC